jgi:hypothetical protein
MANKRAKATAPLLLASLLLILPGRPSSAAEIFWISDPVRPGELVMVIGEDFGPSPRVSLKRLVPGSSASAGQREFGPDSLLSHSMQSLAFELPRDWPAGAFSIEVRGIGTAARGVINAPVVYWAQGDIGTSASSGGTVRAFGRNMVVGQARTRLLLRHETSGQSVEVAATGGDLWEARFALPADLPTGQYTLSVDNGLGGADTRASAGTIRIERPAPPPAAVFDVKSFGAKGDGKADDTRALSDAIAAAGKEGGTVYLPRGRYKVAAALTLPRYVTLAGESRESAALMFTDFETPPPDGLIVGTSHFGVRDLTVFASNHKHVIAGLGHGRIGAENGYVSIERVRVRAMHLRGHPKPEDVERQYRLSSLRFDDDTLRLAGPDLRIVDNDLLGSGRSIALYDARGALVTGNTFYNGRVGWYSFTGSDGLIFENNAVIGADLMSSGGGVNVLAGRASSRNVIFRNNRFERMLGWDREAMTSDGSGGYAYGSATAEAPNRLRLTGEINEKAAKADWRGAGIFILGGRGRGQWARVASLDGDVVTLDRPLTVPPDQSSVVTLTSLQENYLFVGNVFQDVGSAIQYYGTSINHIAADNRAIRSFGFLASGRWYHHYQPSWYCQFIGNEVREGNVYRSGPNGAFLGGEARVALWGVQKAPNRAPLLLGGILRRNRLFENAYIELKGGNDPLAPGVADVVVEGNSLEEGEAGVRQDPGVIGAVVRN